LDKFAVIDIGSNSVRLVVYESLKRAPYVIFNEKILCGLGRGLTESGFMQQPAMDSAVENLKRFYLMLSKMDVVNYRVVATSAVREAKNGADFIERIAQECPLAAEVISGEEEARLSGLGVLCALPGARGIVGDLGGGSLELARVSDGNVVEKASFSIGPLKYQSLDGQTMSSPKADIDTAIDSLEWRDESLEENFYAVGGSWRAIAKIHIQEQNYVLNNVHHYIIERADALELTARLSKMNLAEMGRHRLYMPSRRLKVLSLSAYILNQLIKKLKSKRLVISGYGLREGLLYEGMKAEVRAKDPLIEACHDIAENTGRFSEHGKRLQKWIDPLFSDEGPALCRLRLAASLLSDVGWRGHPEYRSEKVLYEILHGRLLGISHRDAALIGLILFISYGGKTGEKKTSKVESLMKSSDILYAKQVGLALRLAQRISGGTAKGLKSVNLEISDDKLRLNVRKKDTAAVNEVVMKCFCKLAEAFKLQEEVHIV